MPLQHGVPTIRYKVYVLIRWPDGSREWIECPHEHYNADGAERCALKYHKSGPAYGLWHAPIVTSAEGMWRINRKGVWKDERLGVETPSRVLSPEDYRIENKLREKAQAMKDLLK